MEIQYVFHISDIHIKMDNVKNIKNSFIKLIKDIIKIGVDRSVLVIVGDVFENKTYLTTDEIYIFYWMMEGLKEKKINTIIIPGNHDYNINSNFIKNNIDVLIRNLSNIVCLSATQIYSLGGVNFHIFSPIDKQRPELCTSGINIALLHEPVNGACYDNGEAITGGRFSVNDLSDFDYVMLGDIHKPQFLKPHIAYSGSFVQKNKGEGLNHGYILWDLSNKTAEHIFIPLLEVYLKIEARDNQCDMPTLNENQSVRYITFLHYNCTDAYVKKMIKEIKDKYGFINRIINKDHYTKKITQQEEKDDEIKKINQIELIKEILQKEPPEVIDTVIEYHNAKLQNRREINYTRYKLHYLYWSNILCYGENNFIDFRSFKNHIVLLNGKNEQGKSSVIDILIRILFNECTRGYKEDILNKKKSSGFIKLEFSIRSDIFILEQVYESSKNACFHRLFKNGENITKDSINNTYKYLKYDIGIGDYKDFLNMTTALQNRKFLVDIDKRDLLIMLTKILNIDALHDIEKETRSEINFLKRLSKVKETEYNKIIEELKYFKSDNELKKEKEKIDEKLNDTTNKISLVNERLKNLHQKYNFLDISRDDLENELSDYNTQLEGFNIEDKKEINEEKIARYQILKHHVVICDEIQKPDFIDNYEEYKSIVANPPPDYSAVEKNRNTLNNILETFKQNFGAMKYDKMCSSCMKNRKIGRGLYDIEKNANELKQLNSLLEERDKYIIKYNDAIEKEKYINQYYKWREYNEFISLEKEINEAKNYELLCKIYKKREECIEKLDILNKNADIMKKINKFEETLKKGEMLKDKLIISKIENEKKIIELESKLLIKETLENEQKERLNKVVFLDMYYKCINHKSGIPTLIMSNLCKVLNVLCNIILNQIASFDLDIKYDKEFKFYTIANNISIPATMASGYQKFIIDMIMRISLTKISALSNPNLIFIDEGFGSLDHDNFISVANVLKKIKSNFTAMIIITHIEELKAYTDISINIKSSMGESRIQYGELEYSELMLGLFDGVEVTDNETKINDDELTEEQIEQLIKPEGDKFYCYGCKKSYILNKNAINRHLSAKTTHKKHLNFFK